MDGKAGDGNRDKGGKHGLRDAYNPDQLINIMAPLNVKLDSFVVQRKRNGLRHVSANPFSEIPNKKPGINNSERASVSCNPRAEGATIA
jgi:hypothetical protein